MAEDTREQFEEYSTPLISDVLSKSRRTMDSRIGPVFRDAFIAGSALTVDAQPGDNLVIHRAITLAEESDVVVVDAGGHSEAGIWGELMSINAMDRGIAGVVVDGAVRDVVEIGNLGFGVFSSAISPKGSHKELPGSINVPISCGSVIVEPGDVIIGDANGVVAVPAEETTSVLDECERKVADEDNLRESANVSIRYKDEFEEVLGSLEQDRYDRSS